MWVAVRDQFKLYKSHTEKYFAIVSQTHYRDNILYVWSGKKKQEKGREDQMNYWNIYRQYKTLIQRERVRRSSSYFFYIWRESVRARVSHNHRKSLQLDCFERCLWTIAKVVTSHFLEITLLGGVEKLLIPVTKSRVSTRVCPLFSFCSIKDFILLEEIVSSNDVFGIKTDISR